jgi:hypothetical protein
MKNMRMHSLLGVLLCTLPLLAQPPARPAGSRVVAPCELVSAALGLSSDDSPEQGRGYAIHVMNHSSRPLVLPRSPIFGWRIETLEKKNWKLQAEGGPVRRVSSQDEHIIALAPAAGSEAIPASAPAAGSAALPASAPAAPAPAAGSAALPVAVPDLMVIQPAQSADFRFHLPQAEPEIRPGSGLTTLKLSVYWAASAEMAQSNRTLPPCAIQADWVVTLSPNFATP